MSEVKFTPGPWAVAPRPWSFDFVRGQAAVVDANGQPVAFVSSTRGKFEPERANAEHAAKCVNAHDELVGIVRRLTLATDEGDDKAQGTHYVDKTGAIRCKGSFLALIAEARAAIAKAGA